MSTVFDVRGLAISYDGRHVLAGVTTRIHQGRIHALVGPSGCGKTSYLSCLNRLTDLIPGAEVTGSIRFLGEEILEPTCDVVALRRRVGMIFQKPNPFPFSIRKNLDLPLAEHGVKDKFERAAISEQTLRDVGLWEEVQDRLDQSATNLSGGQQQRLCIARALALAPEVLLLDEPCSALDPIASGVVEDLIASLEKRYTVVVVTHNLAQARRIAHDVSFFWIEDGCGSLIEQGPAESLFSDPQHELTRAYLSGVRG